VSSRIGGCVAEGINERGGLGVPVRVGQGLGASSMIDEVGMGKSVGF
jgi:hypothetical protein